VGVDELIRQFGKDGVSVDVALAGERVGIGRAAVGEKRIGGGEGLLVAFEEGRVGRFQLGDQLAARGGVRSRGDFRRGQREELALL
jgi:hypothetical protein